MVRIRTINQTMKMLKELDPDTAISEKALRRAVQENEIPHRNVGNKILLNFETVCEYYGMKLEQEEVPE